MFCLPTVCNCPTSSAPQWVSQHTVTLLSYLQVRTGRLELLDGYLEMLAALLDLCVHLQELQATTEAVL